MAEDKTDKLLKTPGRNYKEARFWIRFRNGFNRASY